MNQKELLEWHVDQVKEIDTDAVMMAAADVDEDGTHMVGFTKATPDFILYCLDILFGELPVSHQILFLLKLVSEKREELAAMEKKETGTLDG